MYIGSGVTALASRNYMPERVRESSQNSAAMMRSVTSLTDQRTESNRSDNKSGHLQ